MNAKQVKKTTGEGQPAERSPTEDSVPAMAELGAPLVEREPDDLIGRAFAVCDALAIAQPMGVIVGRIVEPSCCIFQRIDGSLGMVPTSAFTVRAPHAPRENGQVVLYRNLEEMRMLLAPPPRESEQAAYDAGDGGKADAGGQ